MNRMLVLVGLWLASRALAFPQTDSGSITGTVRDSSGALIPGVTVMVTNEATRITLQSLTGENGEYVITPLRVGIYTVTAELQGFKKDVRSAVALHIQERLKLDFTLQVGQI